MSFHKFNAFTGRLRQSTQLDSLYPLQPHPLQKTELPPMMFGDTKTKIAGTSVSRAKNYSTLEPKLSKMMQKYQADFSVPTFLLRGKSDKLLVLASTALVGIGLAANLYYIGKLLKKY